jgi:hypothetical protein
VVRREFGEGVVRTLMTAVEVVVVEGVVQTLMTAAVVVGAVVLQSWVVEVEHHSSSAEEQHYAPATSVRDD